MVVSADALLQPVSNNGDAARQSAADSARGNLAREDDDRVEMVRSEDK
jgi:hypothetical protein